MKAETIQKFLHAVGLCKKAGRGILGTEMVCEALRKQKNVFLVICPSDVSENTRKKLTDKSAFYGVPLIEFPISGAELAHAVGKGNFCAAFAVLDRGFATLLEDLSAAES